MVLSEFDNEILITGKVLIFSFFVKFIIVLYRCLNFVQTKIKNYIIILVQN